MSGTWVAQSVKRPTLAQVLVSRFVSLSPTWDSLLSAQSPLQILCPVPPPPNRSLSKINIIKKRINENMDVSDLELYVLNNKLPWAGHKRDFFFQQMPINFLVQFLNQCFLHLMGVCSFSNQLLWWPDLLRSFLRKQRTTYQTSKTQYYVGLI